MIHDDRAIAVEKNLLTVAMSDPLLFTLVQQGENLLYLAYWYPQLAVYDDILVERAGGKVARPDGTPYRVDEWNRKGLLGAATPALWDQLAARYAEM